MNRPAPDLHPPAARGNTRRYRVVVAERILCHYRVAFYESLRRRLLRHGVELVLLAGTPSAAELLKQDAATLDWMLPLTTRYLLGNRLCWQPFGSLAATADLVIVLHENKLLYNLWLLFGRRPRRLAFWGHGCNLQSRAPNGVRERFKRWTVFKADWWFAYTDLTARLLTQAGYPRDAVTVVDNATDTAALQAACDGMEAAALAQFRLRHGLRPGPIGLFLGSLYRDKRLDFLFAAAAQIRTVVPDFQLLVVGAGPQQALVTQQVAATDWVHYAGPLRGADKAAALVTADVLLNPGLVGLGILDSFASGTPMFTTDCRLHSPEIDYLDPDRNGVMTSDDVGAYVNAVTQALLQPQRLALLADNARRSAARYTINNMSQRFCAGVLACLGRQA